MKAALAKAPDEFAPYKTPPEVVEAMRQACRARLQVFNSHWQLAVHSLR